jgi:hypothetical protein
MGIFILTFSNSYSQCFCFAFDQNSLRQVMYVCHGQCSGPQCDFTHTMRQCQSLVWLDNRGGNEIESSPIFQSEVVAMTDSSLRKLDEKKQTLSHMRELLADKLESKQQRRRNKSESRKNSNFSEEQVQGLEFPFPLGTRFVKVRDVFQICFIFVCFCSSFVLRKM